MTSQAAARKNRRRVGGSYHLPAPRGREIIVIKRIVVASFVAAVTAVGIAAPADAAPKHHHADSGSVSILRIDWD